MARIGNVQFNVISERRTFDNEVTEHPVEDEGSISDHVSNDPVSYSIKGMVTNPGAAEAHRNLLKLRLSGEPTKYRGRSTLQRAVIESLETDVDEKIRNGFNFSMTIKQIELARPSTVGLLPASLEADTSEVGNAGRVQPQ
ncbi:phage baseplate protein [Salibacterium sp. K-3]